MENSLVNDNAQLCYIQDGQAAYFTSRFYDQWGDDWNDAPYEHNAGRPYDNEGCSIFHVYIEVNLSSPTEDDREHHITNTGFSVEDLNAGNFPWLRSTKYSDVGNIRIMGGISYRNFKNLIYAAHGHIWEPIQNIILGTDTEYNLGSNRQERSVTTEWIEPTEQERERLYWLAEELIEAIVETHKLSMKTLRFGYNEVYPGTRTDNRIRLQEEIGDLLGVVDLMCEHGDLNIEELIKQRIRKVCKLKSYTRSRM